MLNIKKYVSVWFIISVPQLFNSHELWLILVQRIDQTHNIHFSKPIFNTYV